MAFTAFTYGDPDCTGPYMGGAFTGPNFYGAVAALPVPVCADLLGAITGTPYSVTIGAQGGTGGYSFAVSTGALPTGLSLNSSTGVISGTPTVAGSYGFTIRATDSASNTGAQGFDIEVDDPPSAGAANFAYFA